MKHNGHLTFQCVIDYWGACSNAILLYGMPVTILSFDVVHVDSVVIKKNLLKIYIAYTLKKATSVFGCRLSRKLCQCPRITCSVHMAKY